MENIKDKLQKATSKSISSSVKNIFNRIKNNDSFFNDIKKVISQMVSQLSIKNKKQNNEIHKLQKQVIKILNTIKKSLQTEIQYEENQLTEISINAFLSNFKNQISNSLLEYTINIDKNLKKILPLNINDKNQEIHLALQKLYSTFQQNRQYINNIIDKYTKNQFIMANQLYNNINAKNNELLKNIDGVLSIPSINVKISDKKIQSLNKKKYGSTVKSNEIDNKISSIQTSYKDDTDDNLLNNLHKLVVYNSKFNEKQLEIKSKIYSIKQTVNNISKSLNEQNTQEKIQSLHTNLIITDIFSNFKNPKQKIALTQYTKGIFNNPRISKTYNTVLHTKETTDKIYELLKLSFSEKNIFTKLFGGITPDIIQNKIKNKEEQNYNIKNNNDYTSNSEQEIISQQQEDEDSSFKFPWGIVSAISAAGGWLLKKYRQHKLKKPFKQKRIKRPKGKISNKNLKKLLRSKNIDPKVLDKLDEAFKESYERALKRLSKIEAEVANRQWNILMKNKQFSKKFNKLSLKDKLKYKKLFMKNVRKQFQPCIQFIHKEFKDMATTCSKQLYNSNKLKNIAIDELIDQHERFIWNRTSTILKKEINPLADVNSPNGKLIQRNIKWSSYNITKGGDIVVSNRSSRINDLGKRYNKIR